MGSSCTSVKKKSSNTTTILNIDSEFTHMIPEILEQNPSDNLTINISNCNGNTMRNSVAVGNGVAVATDVENKNGRS